MTDAKLITLGRYRLDAHIGEGAMADVYRAYDESIDRRVAVKVLKPEFAKDSDLVARFMREARAAGALNHPNIATIYDVGQFESATYIAMELVEGVTLDAALQAHGRFPFERALMLAQQMASALEYAHARGIVHRDVKPSNMLLGSDGRTLKLLDFGVARIDAPDAAPDGEMGKTQFGQLIGTPRYMSPEQALGTAVDHRSDLFSLGAVLYEMVTGKVAFPGNSLATLAIQVAQKRAEPIEKSAADCPPGFRFVIDKLLAKKPDQRFQSARSLHEAITRELAAMSETASRKGVPLRVQLLAILIVVTGLALWGSVAEVSDREQQTLERMAVVSGSSIAAFVSGNAGLVAADNAGLPAEQQDWAPLQAFVTTAADNPDIRSATIVDTQGIVRASSDASLLGTRYAPAKGEAAFPRGAAIASETESRVSSVARTGGGLRFIRAIRYAGRTFGTVDLVVRRDALDSAIASTRQLLAMLAGAVIVVVAVIGYLSGSMVTRPLNRLRRALDDAATTGFALRISHRRRDEFGAAFDAFNRAAAAMEPLSNGALKPTEALDLTRITAPARKAA